MKFLQSKAGKYGMICGFVLVVLLLGLLFFRAGNNLIKIKDLQSQTDVVVSYEVEGLPFKVFTDPSTSCSKVDIARLPTGNYGFVFHFPEGKLLYILEAVDIGLILNKNKLLYQHLENLPVCLVFAKAGEELLLYIKPAKIAREKFGFLGFPSDLLGRALSCFLGWSLFVLFYHK